MVQTLQQSDNCESILVWDTQKSPSSFQQLVSPADEVNKLAEENVHANTADKKLLGKHMKAQIKCAFMKEVMMGANDNRN